MSALETSKPDEDQQELEEDEQKQLVGVSLGVEVPICYGL